MFAFDKFHRLNTPSRFLSWGSYPLRKIPWDPNTVKMNCKGKLFGDGINSGWKRNPPWYNIVWMCMHMCINCPYSTTTTITLVGSRWACHQRRRQDDDEEERKEPEEDDAQKRGNFFSKIHGVNFPEEFYAHCMPRKRRGCPFWRAQRMSKGAPGAKSMRNPRTPHHTFLLFHPPPDREFDSQ